VNDKLFDWLYGVIVKPVGTLNEIAREKPVAWGLLIYLIISLLGGAAAFLNPETNAVIEELMRQVNMSISIAVMVFGSFLISFIGLFILVGVLHLFGRLFGGRGGYWNLFSAYTFAGFPNIIGVPVMVLGGMLGIVGALLSSTVGFALSIWVLVLQVIALRESHGLSTGMSILVFFLTLLLLVVVPMLIAVSLVMALIFA
jgi:hypothetical protein